jgi:chemotaxis protein MotB
MTTKSAPIIIVKKKGGHGGHHGGAWKVAYADFVTAMMALFIVLWLTSQSEKVKQAVAGYFNDPSGKASLLGTTMAGTGVPVSQVDPALKQLKDKLEAEIKAKKELEKLSKQIEITITSEGLRIELLETKNGTFYESGSARLSDSGQELLGLLAAELKTLPNNLQIEGHTDAAQYSNTADYSNWELSADRANSARRLMQQDGVRQDQVTQIRGYADQMLRVKDNPYDPSNRRISILVKSENGEPPPAIKQGRAVDGLASRADGPTAPAAGPGPAKAPAKPEAGKPAAAAAPTPAANAPVPAPAASAAPAPAQKPGLMGKLTSLWPGKKK